MQESINEPLTVNSLLAKLEQISADHGDMEVVTPNYATWDDDYYVYDPLLPEDLTVMTKKDKTTLVIG